MKARLIIADDHPMVCQGLSEIVERTNDLMVVATAHDGHEAERLARTLPADLLVLDITLPGQSGIKVLESLRAEGLGLPVLFFSMHPASQYVAYVRRAGAQGFIGKEAEENIVLTAIRRILAGGTRFPALSNSAPPPGKPPRKRRHPAIRQGKRSAAISIAGHAACGHCRRTRCQRPEHNDLPAPHSGQVRGQEQCRADRPDEASRLDQK